MEKEIGLRTEFLRLSEAFHSLYSANFADVHNGVLDSVETLLKERNVMYSLDSRGKSYTQVTIISK